MKKIYSLLMLSLATFSFGQTIFYEGFDYATPGFIGGNLTTATDGVGSNNWLTHSNTATTGTGTIDVLSGNLSYTGIAASTGNKVLLPGANATTPRDINRAFSSTANVLYFSALINVIDNTQLSTTAAYFMGLGTTSGISVTGLGARLGIVSSNSGANYRLSIQNTSGGTPTFTENAVDLNFGTTYLVVVKYDKSAAPTMATLWVNPTSLGGAEPASTVTNNSGTSTFATFGSIFLRNTATTPKAEIDEIKIGLTWADVTGAVLSLNKKEISGLKLYPNPVVNGTLFIETATNDTKNIALYDLVGKQVLNVTTSSNEVNVANLNSGLYIVKITENGKTSTSKLIIE